MSKLEKNCFSKVSFIKSTIAQLNPKTGGWAKLGDLAYPRQGNNAIVTNGGVFTLGSWYQNLPAELCTFDKSKFTCVAQKGIRL